MERNWRTRKLKERERKMERNWRVERLSQTLFAAWKFVLQLLQVVLSESPLVASHCILGWEKDRKRKTERERQKEKDRKKKRDSKKCVVSQSILGRKKYFFQITIFLFGHHHKICHLFVKKAFPNKHWNFVSKLLEA